MACSRVQPFHHYKRTTSLSVSHSLSIKEKWWACKGIKNFPEWDYQEGFHGKGGSCVGWGKSVWFSEVSGGTDSQLPQAEETSLEGIAEGQCLL